jgi:beta-glucanase (GH16 family)
MSQKFISILTTILFFSFIVVFTISCGGDKIPTNISLSANIQGANENNPTGDGSGIINLVTTADDAERYAYRIDDGDLIESPNGTLEYTVPKSGTNSYTITAIAYSSSDLSIETSQTLSVERFNSTRNLLFSDEFNTEGPVNTDNWTAEIYPPNNGSWWNGEKQHYTDRTDNAYISDGTLKITAKKETYTFEGSTKNYTSARLISKFTFTYGRVDVRAKLPSGVGTWPAIWTLGSNINTVGWPACGEIDIMEHWGHQPTEVSSAIHTVACSGVNGCPTVRVGETYINDFDSEFHIYSVEWTEDAIDFYVDDVFLYSYNPATKTADNWPFTADQFMILNVAMGGGWFNIDPNFSQSVMEIDYVRVYE